VAKPGKGGTFPTLPQCHANCSFSFNCVNSQCLKEAPGKTGKFPSKAACEASCNPPIHIQVHSWAEMSGAIAAASTSIYLEIIPPFGMKGFHCIPISGAKTPVVNIIGNHETFDAGMAEQFFVVMNATLVVSDITFTAGQPEYQHMCGYRPADLRLSQVRDHDYNGGALMLVESAVLQLTDCIFLNNKANNGGAIYATQDADSPSDIKMILTGCTFIGNSASYGILSTRGGAIAGGGTLHLVDCKFVNNSASSMSTIARSGGGAIVANGETQLTNCTFSGNEILGVPTYNATVYGGAILFCSGSGLLTGCSFTGRGAIDRNDIARDEVANVTFACPAGSAGTPRQMKGKELIQPPGLNCTPH
jgi:predicted outer membrane repeat protein